LLPRRIKWKSHGRRRSPDQDAGIWSLAQACPLTRAPGKASRASISGRKFVGSPAWASRSEPRWWAVRSPGPTPVPAAAWCACCSHPPEPLVRNGGTVPRSPGIHHIEVNSKEGGGGSNPSCCPPSGQWPICYIRKLFLVTSVIIGAREQRITLLATVAEA